VIQSRSNVRPVVLVLAVGLTRKLLPFSPRLQALAEQGWCRSVEEALPAVTCTAQASLLTGVGPDRHGVVANGWLHRDTREVRFWQQSNALIQAEPVYETLRRRSRELGKPFRAAKLFWWFNQGAAVDVSVTPKPHYGADGSKAFGIDGHPRPMIAEIEKTLGPFPFPSFWGPRAGLPSTEWIAKAAGLLLEDETAGPPDLTLVYLPHLDYEPQRAGPSGCDMSRLVGELDAAAAPLLDAADRAGARVWVVSEYGHVDVSRPIPINRDLRRQGLLLVRNGPFGEQLDTFGSRAFAVCDHQQAHIYVRDPDDVARVADLVLGLSGVDRAFVGEERAALGLDHPRSGEIVALARPDAWFAYPFWLDDDQAPDYARTVDIHRKPGFDPCELFLDPAIRFPAARVARRLMAKKLGFRTLFDVVPLDATLVRGSHGLRAERDEDRPVLIGDGPPPGGDGPVAMTAVRGLLMEAMGHDPVG
jgi:predicted AlkP superfamily pyrophosphatase or phosphodiesterase